jgi:hypothetical protein
MAMSDKVKDATEQAKKAMSEHKMEAAGAARNAQTKAREQAEEARIRAAKLKS